MIPRVCWLVGWFIMFVVISRKVRLPDTGYKTLRHKIYVKSGHIGSRTIPTRHSSSAPLVIRLKVGAEMSCGRSVRLPKVQVQFSRNMAQMFSTFKVKVRGQNCRTENIPLVILLSRGSVPALESWRPPPPPSASQRPLPGASQLYLGPKYNREAPYLIFRENYSAFSYTVCTMHTAAMKKSNMK